MERKILKIASFVLALTVIAAVATECYFGVHVQNVRQEKMSGLQILAYNTEQAEEAEEVKFEQQLCIELPEGVGLQEVAVENDYVKQIITIRIPGAGDSYFTEHPLLGRSNHIEDLYMAGGTIEIAMDAVYELKCTAEDGRLYMDFLRPRDIYDKVAVIDAGHGGGAPGAIKQGIMEKDINLAVVKELKELFDKDSGNIGVYYTRTEDVNPTFEQRAQLGGKAGADLFISVHSNSTEDGEMSRYNGTEVLYDELKGEEGFSSKRLAQICLEEATAAMGSKDNGLAHGNSIYIIRNSEVPVALIEIGFMTNQEELDKMTSEEYQKRAALGIYNAVRRAFDEGF